jgi:hypothetical protein
MRWGYTLSIFAQVCIGTQPDDDADLGFLLIPKNPFLEDG